ncbi:MAG TPA: hypothetical protein PK765_05005 [bacterium]|nr:hypothetical protein [bacterium]
MFAGLFDSEQGNDSLARLFVFMECFPYDFLVSFYVEQIVSNLERHAEESGIFAE